MKFIGNMLRCLLLLFFMNFYVSFFAQDLHYSQFWMNPISINPAAAGFFEGDLRVGTYVRTQWLSVTVPYQTEGLYFDFPFFKRTVQQDILGMGAVLNMDRAGDTKYGTLDGSVSFSYSKAVNKKNNHFISLGVSGGMVQKQLKRGEIRTDDQYVGGKYDPNIISQESFPSESFLYPDIGAGLQWYYRPTGDLDFMCGFAAAHVNRPRQSLLKDKNIFLPVKYTANFQMHIPVGDFFLQPALYYSRQNLYNELMSGVLVSYSFHFDRKGFINSLVCGLDYRVGDAIYFVAGGKWRSFSIQITYDFNISSLSKASGGRGGTEVSMAYIYKKPRVIRRHKIPCPNF